MLSSMRLLSKTQALFIFTVLLLVVVISSGWQWRGASPVSSSLLSILPVTEQSTLEHQAQQQAQAAVDRHLVVLITGEQAAAMTEAVAQEWLASGVYQRVDYRLAQQANQLRDTLLNYANELAPLELRQQLMGQSSVFIQQRIQQLYGAIATPSLIQTQEDWLGILQQIEQQLPQPSRVSIDMHGNLVVNSAQQTWQVLFAETKQNAFAGNIAQQVAEQVARARQQVETQGGQLLASSGLLFSADGQQQASQEMRWLGSISIIGSIALLLLFFRSLSSLWVMLPVVIGLASGVTASITIFGDIHVLTLVLGISLIGVTLDYPLHYLSKAWQTQQWHGPSVLRQTLPGLSVGVVTNMIGYLALAFTPFPAVTQVAVFSVAGLLGAYLTTVLLLPYVLENIQFKPWLTPKRWLAGALEQHQLLVKRIGNKALLGMLLGFCALGLAQLNINDDLRNWISSNPVLLTEAQQIGELTGIEPTSQFFLVQAADKAALLTELEQLGKELDKLQSKHYLSGYLSVTQLLKGYLGQPSLAEAVQSLTVNELQPFFELGVDQTVLQQQLQQFENPKLQAIETVLATPLARPWQALWLQNNPQQPAAIVSLQGVQQLAPIAALAENNPQVTWVDQPARLNQLFNQTQREAVCLKLGATAALLLVLGLMLGWQGAIKTLGLSLLAATAAAATLGWLGVTLTLFSLFGLLLVTAIGVDYAIMMFEGVGGAVVSLLGTLIAAGTTWLSFGLLMFSSTPAVSSFGLAVTLGLLFSFILAPWALRSQSAELSIKAGKGNDANRTA